MKIIFLGYSSVNFLGPIVRALREYVSPTRIAAVNVNRAGGTLFKEDEHLFDEVISLPTWDFGKVPFRRKVVAFLRAAKRRGNRDLILLNLVKLKFRFLFRQLKDQSRELLHGQCMRQILAEFDVLHFHFLHPDYLLPLRYAQPRHKVILSFWGSDLFYLAGVDIYAKQLKALSRADVISVSTLEMREVLLSKFGRELSSKVRYARFGIEQEKLQIIEQHNTARNKSRFRQQYGIDEAKIVVTIGYSATASQQHDKVLAIMQLLPKHVLDKIHVLLPITYNNQETEYIQSLHGSLGNYSFPVTAFTRYMSHEEMAMLIISTDIMLNLRTTDALNNALVENLFAGNVVITGAWLPYGSLRRMGVYYEEIAELDDLTTVLPNCIMGLANKQRKYKNNPPIIVRNLNENATALGWAKIYQEIQGTVWRQ